MARPGVADKVTMVTRGDMEWPERERVMRRARDNMSQKANLQRFNILWVPQPKDKHGTCGKMF